MFTLQPEEKAFCLETGDAQQMTPLHYAAMFDHTTIVEYLLEQVRFDYWLDICDVTDIREYLVIRSITTLNNVWIDRREGWEEEEETTWSYGLLFAIRLRRLHDAP